MGAKWLMESVREVISLEQNAMFVGRSIDNAVELIHDGFTHGGGLKLHLQLGQFVGLTPHPIFEKM